MDMVVNINDVTNNLVEFLNLFKPPGILYHRIILHVIETPIMLLKHFKPPKICYRTRLKVDALHHNIVKTIILAECVQLFLYQEFF